MSYRDLGKRRINDDNGLEGNDISFGRVLISILYFFEGCSVHLFGAFLLKCVLIAGIKGNASIILQL
ncbi:hypothetical protein A6E04_14005 [Aliivibrio logei]|uniref:Uncharacterized protein n=2 Tax=Aliivibrio logei TaxID=688 RepID=A0A1B9NYK4_ALILO|nr:hypothetical protein A6E04_14005 [Aliivibrio logei]OEF09925.1 hypothetical protein A1Q5_02045 [Aliivibrio logei 5S-186]